MRSFHPNAVYGNADDEGPNGSKAGVEANKEVCGSRSSALNEVSKMSVSRQLTLDRLCSIDSTQLTALLHAQPWLFKTKMCKFWPSCPRGNKCWFAHGEDELRKPNSVAYMFSGAPFGPNGEAI